MFPSSRYGPPFALLPISHLECPGTCHGCKQDHTVDQALLFGEARASPSQMPCGRRVRNPWFEPGSPKQRAYSSNLEVIDGRLLLETASDTTHSLPGRPTNQSPLLAPKSPAKLAAALYQDPFRILLVSLIGVDRNNSNLAQRERGS